MSLRRHAALNLAGHALPLIAALVTIPTIVHLYGEQRYGALVLALLLATYCGLAELGISHAVAQRLSSQPAAARGRWQNTLTPGFLASGALGLAGGLLALIVGRLYFAAPPDDGFVAQEQASAMLWLVPLVPLCTMGAVLLASLQAQRRFIALNLVQGLGGVGLQLAPLLVALVAQASLSVALGAIVVVRTAMLLVLWGLHERDIRPTWPDRIDCGELRTLMGYGGWASVSAAVGPLMVVLDRFVIGQLLGVRSVPTYAIPFQLAEKTTLLSAAMNHALFPKLASTQSAQQSEELALQALGLLALASAPPVAIGVILMGPFLAWWLPGDMGIAGAAVAHWLLVGFWLNGLALVPLTLLYATGRPAVVARCHLTELVPYLALLMLAVEHAGLIGAALAFTARALADLVLLSWKASMLRCAARAVMVSGLVILVASVGVVMPDGGFATACTALAGLMIAGQTLLTARRLALRQRTPRDDLGQRK